MQVTTHAAARATFADPNLTVPPVTVAPAHEATTGMAWLRATVARFSSGPTHTRRRTLTIDQLSTIDIPTLRGSAHARTTEILAPHGTDPVDLMPTVARTLPTELVAAALNLPATPAAVAAIARAYPTGAADPAADAAVHSLITATADETIAARIGLLAQTYDATAGLIGNAAFIMLRDELGDPAEAILAETLRHTPPVRATKRVTPNGDPIDINLDAANRDPSVFPAPDEFDPTRANRDDHLDFGFGPHSCPGRHIATAIAAGVLDAIRDHRLTTRTLTYEPPANLRVPTHLVITAPKPENSPSI